MLKWGKLSGPGFGLAIAAAVLAFGDGRDPAHAQFVCDSDAAGEDGQGANATGSANNVACGPRANASGGGSSNTASGADSDANGGGSGNTASGGLSNASGSGSRNMAAGFQSNASGEFSSNTASGFLSNASGDGSSNTAMGTAANASGTDSENVAIGSRAVASGDGTSNTAVGAGARATFANSSAFGAGATATRDDQMAFGTSGNTYTMNGITSDASRAAQQGPLELVTTDAKGNLASDGGFFQSRIDALGRRDQELAEGIAISLAIQQPIFHNGQTFGIRFGYGNFDGSDALGLSAAGVIDRGSFGKGSSVTLDGGLGFGTANGTVAGRAGVTFGW